MGARVSRGGVAYSLGGLVGPWLWERLGQPFVVENRPGGASNIRDEAVVRAAPDGHTLLLVDATGAINATLYDKLNFVFLRDSGPIARITRLPFVMLVPPSVSPKTLHKVTHYH